MEACHSRTRGLAISFIPFAQRTATVFHPYLPRQLHQNYTYLDLGQLLQNVEVKIVVVVCAIVRMLQVR